MFYKLLKSDLKRHPIKNLLLVGLTSLSLFIVCSVFFLIKQTVSSISDMYQVAQPPHFIQMHRGQLNQEEIDQFNQSYSGVKAWQTVQLLNVEGKQLTVYHQNKKRDALADSQLDISFVKQNKTYDLLLNAQHEKIALKSGEVAVPKLLRDQFSMKIGDRLRIQEGAFSKTFTITEVAHDAQMNSTLASSTRFLVSDADFAELTKNLSQKEVIIETYFNDTGQADSYQSAYKKASLPQNGPSLTYRILFFLSALTDLATAAIYFLAGGLLLVITLICLRFILLAEIEAESGEIGLLKAIGLPNKTIEQLYLQKIVLTTGLGSLIGYSLALVFLPVTTQRIKETFGQAALSLVDGMLGFVIAILLFFVITFYSWIILNRIKKASVVDLLVQENGFVSRRRKRKFPPVRHLSANLLITRRKLKNGYAFPFWLCLFISLTILLPSRLIHTMNAPEFITYMGSAKYDISLEVTEGEGVDARAKTARQTLQKLSQSHSVSPSEIRRTQLQATSSQGDTVSLPVDMGQDAGKELHYTQGHAARNNQEIALSLLAAEELGKGLGDKLTLTVNGQSISPKIVGLYQDITNGGKTAKLPSEFGQAHSQKYIFYLRLTNHHQKKKILQLLTSKLGKKGYRINDAKGIVQQTLGGMIQELQKASNTTLGVSLLIFGSLLFLFLSLHVNRNLKEFIFKRTLGLSFSSVYLQELYPLAISSLLGAFSGILLVQYLGEPFISSLFGLLNSGIQQLSFVAMSWTELAVYFCVLFLIIAILTYMALIPVKKQSFLAYRNE